MTFTAGDRKSFSSHLVDLINQISIVSEKFRQCWKRPVALWPNVPNFCLGPPEISKLWTLVAQIYLSGSSE